MKSKVEIIDAINRCGQFENHCDGCPYGDSGDRICIDLLFDDIISIFNKSDFEVVEEVLTRSKKQDWLGTGFHGRGYELERLDDVEVPHITFDGEGNIL